MFGIGLVDAAKLGVGAVVGGIIASALVMLVAFTSWIPDAKEEARQQERAAALKKSMELIEKRSETNAEIRNLDNSALCAALGGVYINNECQ